MMLLKHFRDWSFEDLTREVRANLVYREFTRIGGGKVPDDKTMGRLARQLADVLLIVLVLSVRHSRGLVRPLTASAASQFGTE
jgi:hypothetical protein